MTKPIFFDIETGGLHSSGKKASSILSLATLHDNNLQELYARPTQGSWLSDFSKQNILPQLEGKSTLHEKDLINSFIQTLNQNPKSPLVGFNSQNFDIPFLQERAASYGLDKELTSSLQGRRQIDIGLRLRDSIVDPLLRHPFPRPLTRDQDKIVGQLQGYQKASTMSPQDDFKFRGWKQEQLFPLLFPEDAGMAQSAHQAGADVKMTQKLFENLHTSDTQQKFHTPDFAEGWMKSTIDLKQKAEHIAKDAGTFYQPKSFIRELFDKHNTSSTKTGLKFAAGATALAAGAVAYSSLFSAKDDNYNTITGLPHGGEAQQRRREHTEFGSGWRGIASLPEEIARTMAKQSYGVSGSPQVFKESTLLPYLMNLEDKAVPASVLRFQKDLDQAIESGFDAIHVINTSAIRRLADSSGESFSELLKHTIKHEQIHTSRALTHGNRARIKPPNIPEKFQEHMNKQYANSPRDHGEEFIANYAAVTRYPVRAKLDKRVSAAIAYSTPEELSIAEQYTRKLTTGLVTERKKRILNQRAKQQAIQLRKNEMALNTRRAAADMVNDNPGRRSKS